MPQILGASQGPLEAIAVVIYPGRDSANDNPVTGFGLTGEPPHASPVSPRDATPQALFIVN